MYFNFIKVKYPRRDFEQFAFNCELNKLTLLFKVSPKVFHHRCDYPEGNLILVKLNSFGDQSVDCLWDLILVTNRGFLNCFLLKVKYVRGFLNCFLLNVKYS